ncbi:hypothetical protein NKH77_27785 [Streptomyces sp. M19]
MVEIRRRTARLRIGPTRRPGLSSDWSPEGGRWRTKGRHSCGSRYAEGAAVLAAMAAVAAGVLDGSPARAVVGGDESTEAYSFMGSFQPSFPRRRADKHGCGWRSSRRGGC